MTDNLDSLVLEHLRAIRADISSIKEDVREVKTRLAVLESGVAGLRRDFADLGIAIAGQDIRSDRVADRLEQIEKRLDLAGQT